MGTTLPANGIYHQIQYWNWSSPFSKPKPLITLVCTMARRPHRIWLADSVEKFCLDLMRSVLRIIFIWRFHRVARDQRILDSELDTEVTYHKVGDLKIKVWSFYCKLYVDKLRFAVNGFTLPVYPYLGLTPILAEKLSTTLVLTFFWNRIRQSIRKRVPKSCYFFSNVELWCFRVQKISACGKSLTSWAV